MKPIQKEPDEPTLENLSKALTKRGFANKIEKQFIAVVLAKDQKVGCLLNGLEVLFGKRIYKTDSPKGFFVCFYL